MPYRRCIGRFGADDVRGCRVRSGRGRRNGVPHSTTRTPTPNKRCTWNGIGFARHHLGQFDRAVDCHQRAIELYLALGDRIGEVEALIRLGNATYATGESVAARDTWRRALGILDDVAHPDAEHVRAQLTNTTSANHSRTRTLYWPHR
jgi:tetratricopeptide (TPR) repeat protein